MNSDEKPVDNDGMKRTSKNRTRSQESAAGLVLTTFVVVVMAAVAFGPKIVVLSAVLTVLLALLVLVVEHPPANPAKHLLQVVHMLSDSMIKRLG